MEGRTACVAHGYKQVRDVSMVLRGVIKCEAEQRDDRVKAAY